MKTKILLVSNTTWSLYNFRLRLMNALRIKGFGVSFCTFYDEYAGELEKKGFKYIRINLNRKGKNGRDRQKNSREKILFR